MAGDGASTAKIRQHSLLQKFEGKLDANRYRRHSLRWMKKKSNFKNSSQRQNTRSSTS